MEIGRLDNPFRRPLTPVVRTLLIATTAVFLLAAIGNLFWPFTRFVEQWGGLSLAGLRRFRLWQPITYLFFHAGLWHLVMNLLGLYFFGCVMEDVLGSRRFLTLYLVAGIVAGLAWLGIGMAVGESTRGYCIGASGAVFAILGAFAGLFPTEPITLLLFLFLPVSVPARTVVALLGAIALFSLIFDRGQIADSAHLAGGLVGYWYGRRLFPRRALLGTETPHVVWDRLRRLWMRMRTGLSRRRFSPPLHHDPSPEEIDRLLEKIATQGLHRLTRRERTILERASQRLQHKRTERRPR